MMNREIDQFLGQEPEHFMVLKVNSAHIPQNDHVRFSFIGSSAFTAPRPPHKSGLIAYLVGDMPQVYLANLAEVDRSLINLHEATWAILDAAAAADYGRVEFDGNSQAYPALPGFGW
jgi:hypothetical protein